MKIGLQMYTLREKMTDEASTREAIRKVKATGYEVIQLAGNLTDMAAAGRIALEEGLPPVSFMASLDRYTAH